LLVIDAGRGHFAGIQMQNKATGTSILHLVFRQNGSAFTNTKAPLTIPPFAKPSYLAWGAVKAAAKIIWMAAKCPFLAEYIYENHDKLFCGHQAIL